MRLRSLWIAIAAVVFLQPPARAGEAITAKRFGDVTEERVLAERDSGDNWLVNGGRFTGEHYSPLAQISGRNVGDLGLAWATDIPSFTLAAEPLVVDGVVYLSGALSHVFAVDAASGKLLWKFDPQVRLDLSRGNSMSARVNRGVAVWKGKVYVGTADCRLIAIDAAAGRKLWESMVCDPQDGAGTGIRGAPRVAADKIFMGHAGSDYGARGSLAAFDAETGAEVWRFWTVPGDPAQGFETKELERAAATWAHGWAKGGGGVVWEAIRYDPKTGSVIFGTASTFPVNAKLRGIGDELFTNSIISVDADTGEYRWHYQTVPSDTWDYDATMPKIVTNLELGGKSRRVVLEAPKNGFFYVLDAVTGELLSADPIVTITWATHVDLETGRPVEVPGARYYENEDPEQLVSIAPGRTGAHNWQPMSFSPRTGLVYIPLADLANTFSAGGYYGARVEVPDYGPGMEVAPGSGQLLAWDPVRREKRWSVDHALPFNGGVLATAGDLVFQGTATGAFRAYAADSGRILWSAQTDSSVLAAPVSYSVDGEQYVLVPSGLGGGLGYGSPLLSTSESSRGPCRLLAFKLGATAPLPMDTRRPQRVPKPPARKASAEQIERGAGLWLDIGCVACHGLNAIGVGRRELGGHVPDLRYMPASVHEEWHGVVLGGSRRLQGMPVYADSISAEDSEALHAYVIEQAWKLYESRSSATR